MSSLRQNKVSRLLLKELSIIFQQNGTDWFPNTMISVTVVRVSPDLSFAKVYLSIFGATDPKECVEKTNENEPKLKKKATGGNCRHRARNRFEPGRGSFFYNY